MLSCRKCYFVSSLVTCMVGFIFPTLYKFVPSLFCVWARIPKYSLFSFLSILYVFSIYLFLFSSCLHFHLLMTMNQTTIPYGMEKCIQNSTCIHGDLGFKKTHQDSSPQVQEVVGLLITLIFAFKTMRIFFDESIFM